MNLTIKQKVVSILLVLVSLLAFTNPRIDDFSQFIGLHKKHTQLVATKREYNYFIFSTYSSQISYDNELEKQTYIGVFGNFYPLGDQAEKVGAADLQNQNKKLNDKFHLY